MQKLIILLIVFVGYSASAAIIPLHAAFKKQNKYIGVGVILGGEAQRDMILSEVRRSFSAKKKLERIVFEVSAANGKKGRVGYFHIATEPRRVTIDLSGVAAAQMSLNEVAANLKKSPLIRDASITMDPEDRSATIVLALSELKAEYKVEAFELKSSKESG